MLTNPHDRRDRRAGLFGPGERRRHKGGGGGGGGSTTTVQKADPWYGQQPFLTDVMNNAMVQSDVPMQFYGGQTYAPLSAETSTAQELQAQRALNGSPLVSASQDQLTRTMGGDYLNANPVNDYLGATASGAMLNGNPYRDAMMGNAAQQITNQYNSAVNAVNARFSASGRYGSGAQQQAVANEQDALARNLGNAATQIYYGDYQAERQNQMQAANQIGNAYAQERGNQLRGMMFAPSLAQEDYADIARLAEVGAAKEDYAQQGINEAVDRFNYQQQEPWQRLGLYSNLVNGQYGSTVSTTQPVARRSVGAGLLGGAATGGGLGYMFGGGDPYATAGGAALGGLLGMF